VGIKDGEENLKIIRWIHMMQCQFIFESLKRCEVSFSNPTLGWDFITKKWYLP
jgi:hypothetical protein